jgi:4-hydroxybenzoate polyprenyltransferase
MTTSSSSPGMSSPARSLIEKLQLAAMDIKLSHSVFALPFAVLGAFLARGSGERWRDFGIKLGLVVVCMVLARTWAMLVNRLVDRRFDKDNPRTARRLFASGRLRARDGWLMAGACVLGTAAAASAYWFMFANPWPVLLVGPVLAWLAFYSFTKRFTMFCHGVLGLALALAPVCAALAVRPEALSDTRAIWLIAGVVVLWVAGFDVIYALQDVDFDLKTRLHSLPSTLGPRGAIWCSRVLHAGSLTLLIVAALAEPRFGAIFYAGVALVGGLLMVEHGVLARQGLRGLDMAFFTINGVVSCVLGLCGVLDLL